MGVVKNLMVRAGADFSAMRKEMQKAQKDLSNFKAGISKAVAGIAATLATIGIGGAIKSATNDAMQFEAAVTQLSRTMGESAGAFRQWANENAAAFGMSRLEIVKYGAVYSNLLSAFSSGTAETTQRTQDLLKASAIVAAATGRTMEDTMERIRSGLLGNTEAIEDLGINVNIAMIESTNAFKQFANGQHWNQLNFQTQQQIRLMAILEQAQTKYGDQIANTTIARQNQLVAQLKNVKLALGQAFLPIYNYILPALIRFATALATVMNYIAQFTTALFGGTVKAQQAQTQATNAQVGAVSNLGDAYKAAGNQAKKAGKKAKDSVASFDQLNLVGGKSSDSGGGDSGGAEDIGGIGGAVGDPGAGLFGGMNNGMVEVGEKARAMAEKVRSAFETMKRFIVDNKEIIISALIGLASAFTGMWLAVHGGAIAQGALKALQSLVTFANPLGLIAGAIAALVTLSSMLYFKWDDLDPKWQALGVALLGGFGQVVLAIKLVEKNWDSIKEVALNVWNNVLKPFNDWLVNIFTAAWNGVATAIDWLQKNVITPFGQFLTSFNNGVLKPLGAVLKDALGVAFKFVGNVAKDLWNLVLVPFGNFIKNTFTKAIEGISEVFTVWWNKILKPFGSWVKNNFEPIFKDLGKVITNLWHNIFKPFGQFMLNNFQVIFKNVFETIGKIIKGLETALGGLIDFLTGVFTGNWEKAWSGMKDIFKGIFDSLVGIVKAPLNLIIDAINKVIEGLNKINIDMPAWMGGGSFGMNISKIPKLAKGGLAFGPTLAMVGDNRGASSDPEVIAPLSKLGEYMNGGDSPQVVSVLNSILRAIQNGQNVNVQISQKEIGKAAIQEIKNETRRTGAVPFPV